MGSWAAFRWAILAGLCLPVFASAEENVYNKALPSTVWIVQPVGGNKIRMGSGSLIDVQKKLILTNFHVVGDQKEATVFFPVFDSKKKLIPERDKYMELLRAGAGIPGKVLFTEQSKDLAVIQLSSIPKGTPALKLAKDSPGPGDRVHSIGSPGASGGLFNYTDGSVKIVYQKKYRAGSGPNDPNAFVIDARVIETSSGTNKGDSGGPLMNDKCELIGVTQGMLIAGDDTRPISYFIDVSEVKNVLRAHKIALSGPGTATVASDTPPSTADKPAEKPAKTTAANPATEKRKNEETATGRLSGAKFFVQSNPKEAKRLLQEIIEQFPDTEAAAEAKKLLDKLK